MEGRKVFDLAKISRSFATRRKGKEVARLVVGFAKKANSGAVVVDWNGVSAASPSFIDEFVKRIQKATHMDSSCKRILFAAQDPRLVKLVYAILRRRDSTIRLTAQHDEVETLA